MNRLIIPITLAAVLCVGYASGATLRGAYTDPAGFYVEPGRYYAERDGVRMDPSGIVFENTSTAAGPNVPGKVDVVLGNITATGHYVFRAMNSAGSWRGYDWDYAGPDTAAAREVWEYNDRTLTSPVTLAMSTYTGIDSRLTASHGSGPWSAAGSVTVVPFQGGVSYESVRHGSDLHVVRGDTVAIPYQAGTDLAGREVWFGAKANPADATYAIGPLDMTAYVTDASAGTGLVSLTTADTGIAPRRYFAEVEVRGQGQVLTPLRFYLWIDPDVIR